MSHVITFHSTSVYTGYPNYRERNGQVVELVAPLGRESVDAEAGPMWHIRFSDGAETDAFAEELFIHPLEMRDPLTRPEVNGFTDERKIA